MIIKLIDKTEFTVTVKEAESVNRAIESGKDWIMFGNERIRVSSISTILQGSSGQSTPFINVKKIESRKCKAKKSIQLEISRRIRNEHGKDWAEIMKNHDFRETIRLEIHEDNPEIKWCDFIAKTCVCYDRNSQSSHAWADIFPGSLETLKEES